MHVEVKEYLKIGMGRLMNIKVFEYEKVKDLASLDGIEPLYDGSIEEAPEEIKETVYVKCDLRKTTIYYI